ncbi:hypothetical protein [uncultured Duncaniella sp.]|uniref:hypothetical protein n=1 Tax=uncultured Duncaniella sp. TaxID=2768039 RepID=UPI0025AA2A76|nr:hypothetical protein [uncultured Duncaniella sp.]
MSHICNGKKSDYGYCKAAPILECLGHKWTQAALIKMTDFGKFLLPHVESLINRGHENFGQIMAKRATRTVAHAIDLRSRTF